MPADWQQSKIALGSPLRSHSRAQRKESREGGVLIAVGLLLMVREPYSALGCPVLVFREIGCRDRAEDSEVQRLVVIKITPV